MSDAVKSRQMREYQRSHRNGKRSYRTEIEDLKMMLAWQAGELSEGQVSKIWACSRIEARERIDAARIDGSELGAMLFAETRKPLERLKKRRDKLNKMASELDAQILEHGA